MGRRDVINYYISVQNQYYEMLADVKDFDDAFKLGKITEEQFNQAKDIIVRLKENYDRLTYIILLLNEPNRKNKKDKYKKQNKLVYDYLANSTECYIKSENEDVLKEFKKFIKENKHD